MVLKAIRPTLENLQHLRGRAIVIDDDITVLKGVDKIAGKLGPVVITGSKRRRIVSTCGGRVGAEIDGGPLRDMLSQALGSKGSYLAQGRLPLFYLLPEFALGLVHVHPQPGDQTQADEGDKQKDQMYPPQASWRLYGRSFSAGLRPGPGSRLGVSFFIRRRRWFAGYGLTLSICSMTGTKPSACRVPTTASLRSSRTTVVGVPALGVSATVDRVLPAVDIGFINYAEAEIVQ